MNLEKGKNALDLMAMWRESGGALESLPAGAAELRSRRGQETVDEGLSASMGSRNYPWCVEPDEGLAASCFTHPAESCWSHPDEGFAAASHTANRVCIPGPAASCYTSPGNCPYILPDEGLAASSRSGGRQYCFAPPRAD